MENDVSYLITEWDKLSECQNALCNPFTGQYFIRGEVNFTVSRFALATKENNKQKNFSKKQKGFRDGLSYSQREVPRERAPPPWLLEEIHRRHPLCLDGFSGWVQGSLLRLSCADSIPATQPFTSPGPSRRTHWNSWTPGYTGEADLVRPVS